MLIVIGVILFILFIFAQCNDRDFASVFTGALLLVVGIALVVNIVTVVNGRVIDQKIEMYSEENAVIEESIDKLVSQYMTYESSTLSEFNNDSAIVLISLYPELKSDELVKTQIEIYTQNNEMIRNLKASKIDVSSAKWWVYFGK